MLQGVDILRILCPSGVQYSPGQLHQDPGHFLSVGSSLVFPLLLTKGERVVCDLDGDSLPSDRQLASPQQSSTGELHE